MIRMSKILFIFYIYYMVLALVSYASEVDINQKFLYIGTEAGVVEPVVSKFRHESETDLRLKRSTMYSGKIGYIFYPGMAIEFSATYQPKYRLHYVLPHRELSNGSFIPKTPGKTKVTSNIYMLNLVYDLNKIKQFTPFVIMGVGIARVNVKATTSRWALYDMEYFRVRTTRTNCLAWQIGVGFSKELTPNFSIDIAAKLQVAHGIKINYDVLNIMSQKFARAKDPIKKTIGVGEFGIGFTYKLPI